LVDVAVNNTPAVVLAGRAHAVSSWFCSLLPVSLDHCKLCKLFFNEVIKNHNIFHARLRILPPKKGVTKSHRSDITTGGGTNSHRSDIATDQIA